MLRHGVDRVVADIGDNDPTIRASLDIDDVRPGGRDRYRRNFGAEVNSARRTGALLVMTISALAILSAT
jgi:hypothetical protein